MAQEDPSYLTWMWTTNDVFDRLSDAARDVLEALMEQHHIPFNKKARR